MRRFWILLLALVSLQSVAKLNIVTEHFPPAQYLDENNQIVGVIADKVNVYFGELST